MLVPRDLRRTVMMVYTRRNMYERLMRNEIGIVSLILLLSKRKSKLTTHSIMPAATTIVRATAVAGLLAMALSPESMNKTSRTVQNTVWIE